MGNVQGEIDRISGAKTTLGDYLASNGVNVADSDKIDAMAGKLASVTEKQDKIAVSGMLKGDGAGNITAATAGSDYVDVSAAGFAALAAKLAAENEAPQDEDYYLTQKAAGGDCCRRKTSYLAEYIKTKLFKTVCVTLPADGWANASQSVSVEGVTETDDVFVTYAPESRAAWREADVYCSEQGAGTLTFSCEDTPTAALKANVIILKMI